MKVVAFYKFYINLDIPLDILFNKEINEIKDQELLMNAKPKPITFRVMDGEENDENLEGYVRYQLLNKIIFFRFEIEGGGKAIHTSFVRNNELEFFEFVKGFNNENLK